MDKEVMPMEIWAYAAKVYKGHGDFDEEYGWFVNERHGCTKFHHDDKYRKAVEALRHMATQKTNKEHYQEEYENYTLSCCDKEADEIIRLVVQSAKQTLRELGEIE